MKIGIICDSSADASRLSSLGHLAEKSEIDCLWLSHTSRSKDQFLNLAHLARDTKRIRLGLTGISPFEIHPVRMGMLLLTLNEISKGRAAIVIGSGGAEIVRNFGLHVKKPLLAVKECAEIILKMASDVHIRYKGSFYNVESYKANWRFEVRPTIYIGANKPMMLDLASKVADGIMMADIPIEYVETIVRQIHETVSKTGRKMGNFCMNNFFAWHVKRDYKEAIEEARRYLAFRSPSEAPRSKAIGLTLEEINLLRKNKRRLLSLLLEGKQPKGIPERTLDKIVEGLTITGESRKIDDCIEKLHQFKKKGLNEIALRLYEEPASSIRLIGEKVIPHFTE